MTAPFRNFKGMCWPVPCEKTEDLEHALRYAPKCFALSKSERLLAASIVAAYRDLISKPKDRRDAIIRELRKGPGVDA